MRTVSQTIKFRNQRRVKEQHNPLMRIGLGFGILLCLVGVIGSLAGVWFYSNLTRDLPSIDTLPSLLEPPEGILLHPTRLFDRTHEHVISILENPAVTGKRYLSVDKEGQTSPEQFSKYLIDATIVASDPGFWNHPGFTLAGWSDGTHPTLAQKLVSDLVLIDEPVSLQRNIRERLLAAQVTYKFGHEKILEWYLNSAPYGDFIYGADAAALAYFGKSASMLDLGEAAMLAVISKSPAINPNPGSQVLKLQQQQVIQAMLNQGLIATSDAQKAIKEDLQFQIEPERNSIAPAFTDQVLEQLGSQLNLDRIRRGGFDIVTTLDYELQMQVKCATDIQLARIQGAEEAAINMDIEDCEAAKLLPNLQLSNENQFEDINANVVVLDPSSGQILAFVGDNASEGTPVHSTEHSAGTILSPFLYLSAFARGMNPATLLWDIPNTTVLEDEKSDQNNLTQGSSTIFHGPVRARIAMVNDYLAATAEVLKLVRVENILLTEKRFGIENSEVLPVPAITVEDLYSRKITVLDGIAAYGVLANQGIMAGQPNFNEEIENDPDSLNPTSVLQVIGVDGKIWLDWSVAQSRSIVSPQLAFLSTHILSDENARRPSLGHPNPLEIGRPAAAKVGITDNGDDAWTIGYIPQLAVGIWLGHTGERTGVISWELPAGLWHAITKYASRHLPVEEFTVPKGIRFVQVCDPSGLLVSELCPTIAQEAFLEGSEPTQADNLYQQYSVNRETGLLATIFTPPDMVEEKVFLKVPPQAVEWASNSGFPLPPDNYDVIYASEPKLPDVQITSPQTFDHVRGQVQFIGSAAGPNFSYYRIQVGKGLNPQEWIQTGDDINKPVNDGLLGTWDTSGLEGLYVVQLQVVRQDRSVDKDNLEITIDDTQPQVEILTPAEGEEISFQPGESIFIQVSASDNLMLERVEFLVDGEIRMTLLQTPFIILWPERIGEHKLTVRAYDLAGNSGESSISFSVNN